MDKGGSRPRSHSYSCSHSHLSPLTSHTLALSLCQEKRSRSSRQAAAGKGGGPAAPRMVRMPNAQQHPGRISEAGDGSSLRSSGRILTMSNNNLYAEGAVGLVLTSEVGCRSKVFLLRQPLSFVFEVLSWACWRTVMEQLVTPSNTLCAGGHSTDRLGPAKRVRIRQPYEAPRGPWCPSRRQHHGRWRRRPRVGPEDRV